MKKAVLCAWILVPFFGTAQAFNDIRFERAHKRVGIARPRPKPPPERKDTIVRTDTVFVHAKLPPGKMEKVSLNPEIGKVSAPLDVMTVTSGYGMRFHPLRKRWAFHAGVDFRADRDTVRSVLDGIVRDAGYDTGLGHFLKVGHGSYVLTYGHLSQYFHLPGERAKAGEPIGITGNTGLSTGEHLHLAVHRDGRPVDPLFFLAKLIKLKNDLTYNKTKTDSVKRSATEKTEQTDHGAPDNGSGPKR